MHPNVRKLLAVLHMCLNCCTPIKNKNVQVNISMCLAGKESIDMFFSFFLFLYDSGFPNTVLMATDVLKLRVILDDVNAERLILPSRPETVQALISEMKDKLNLTYDFHLQFEDPEFNNALNNLVNMEDLPPKATIKIVIVRQHRLTRATMPMASHLYCSNIFIRGGVYAKREQLCPGRGKNCQVDQGSKA